MQVFRHNFITSDHTNSLDMTEEIDSKSNLHTNYVQFKSEPNVYEMKILTVTESQNSDRSVDIESLATAKSF